MEYPITLFTVPRAFEGPTGLAQRRAIESWTKLRPPCEILLLGDDQGIADAAKSLGLRHIPTVAKNNFGTPLVDSIFAIAEQEARGTLLCYINADIILTKTFVRAAAKINFDRFLAIGRRWDIEPECVPSLEQDGWEDVMMEALATNGHLHEATGIDYFMFTRGLWPRIPPFALGRWVWDNWLVYAARASHVPVIDATSQIVAIHQNHGYGHQAGGDSDLLQRPEARANLALAGGYRYAFTIADATHFLDRDAIRRRRMRDQTIPQVVARLSALHPRLTLPLRVILRLRRALESPGGRAQHGGSR